MYKLIIAGSRGFNDYALLCQKLDKQLATVDKADIEIVSGTARGADKLGERYAQEHGIAVKQFPADWGKGKWAGYVRNKQMAEYSTHAILFWDGVSKGTGHMRKLCVEHDVKHIVVRY